MSTGLAQDQADPAERERLTRFHQGVAAIEERLSFRASELRASGDVDRAVANVYATYADRRPHIHEVTFTFRAANENFIRGLSFTHDDGSPEVRDLLASCLRCLTAIIERTDGFGRRAQLNEIARLTGPLDNAVARVLGGAPIRTTEPPRPPAPEGREIPHHPRLTIGNLRSNADALRGRYGPGMYALEGHLLAEVRRLHPGLGLDEARVYASFDGDGLRVDSVEFHYGPPTPAVDVRMPHGSNGLILACLTYLITYGVEPDRGRSQPFDPHADSVTNLNLVLSVEFPPDLTRGEPSERTAAMPPPPPTPSRTPVTGLWPDITRYLYQADFPSHRATSTPLWQTRAPSFQVRVADPDDGRRAACQRAVDELSAYILHEVRRRMDNCPYERVDIRIAFTDLGFYVPELTLTGDSYSRRLDDAAPLYLAVLSTCEMYIRASAVTDPVARDFSLNASVSRLNRMLDALFDGCEHYSTSWEAAAANLAASCAWKRVADAAEEAQKDAKDAVANLPGWLRRIKLD